MRCCACCDLCQPRRSLQDYKEFLEELAKPEDKNATPFIVDYKEYHTGGWDRGPTGPREGSSVALAAIERAAHEQSASATAIQSPSSS